MSEYSETKEWDFEKLNPNGNGDEPPEQDVPTTNEDDADTSKKEKKKFKTWLLIPALAAFLIIIGAIMSHNMMYQPVMPMGKESYLSDMGFIGGFFEGPKLEAATVADFFAMVFSFASVILADIFYHFMLIAGFLDRPEHFLSKPSLRVQSYFIIFFYVLTICMEAMALYWRMELNQQILNDPNNPLNDLQIHGMGELIGYSLAIICLNAACAFLVTQIIHFIKKEMEK